jgi:superfamily II DNA/RNA helicase
MPAQIEDYVHRIGRTGRAGEDGTAISFATQKEKHLIKKLEEKFNFSMEVLEIEGLEPKKVTAKSGDRKPRSGFKGRSSSFKSTGKKTPGFYSTDSGQRNKKSFNFKNQNRREKTQVA